MGPKINKRKANRSKHTISSDEGEQLQISDEEMEFCNQDVFRKSKKAEIKNQFSYEK